MAMAPVAYPKGTTVQAMPVGRTQRRPRRPKHNFYVRHRPYEIQATAIAPVIPGETMQNALLQVRSVTDPIKNPLIGWWLEHYLFYVKHRDMIGTGLDAGVVEDMMLDPTYDLSAYLKTTASEKHYFDANTGGQMHWLGHCMSRIVTEYFRDEGEDSTDHVLSDSSPLASIMGNSWLDSVMLETAYDDPDIDFTSTTPGEGDGTAAVLASEVEAGMRQWMFLRHNNLTELSYEDYLASYGIRPKETELHIPELLRYVREWQYPSNTIDDSDGTPRSAVSWTMQERADKDRFFREPGFIVGLTCCRPKIYLSYQTSYGAVMLDNAYTWLPALLNADPATSIKLMPSGQPPLEPAHAIDYIVDVKDLFMYGDQFLRQGSGGFDGVTIDLPSAALNKRYPVLADLQSLFVDQDPGDKQHVNQDGVWQFNILSAHQDTTPTMPA